MTCSQAGQMLMTKGSFAAILVSPSCGAYVIEREREREREREIY